MRVVLLLVLSCVLCNGLTACPANQENQDTPEPPANSDLLDEE